LLGHERLFACSFASAEKRIAVVCTVTVPVVSTLQSLLVWRALKQCLHGLASAARQRSLIQFVTATIHTAIPSSALSIWNPSGVAPEASHLLKVPGMPAPSLPAPLCLIRRLQLWLFHCQWVAIWSCSKQFLNKHLEQFYHLQKS
jgi:hypothetical protein